jgi:hypothetical protein
MLGKLASGPVARSLRPGGANQLLMIIKRDFVFGKRQMEQVKNW